MKNQEIGVIPMNSYGPPPRLAAMLPLSLVEGY